MKDVLKDDHKEADQVCRSRRQKRDKDLIAKGMEVSSRNERLTD